MKQQVKREPLMTQSYFEKRLSQIQDYVQRITQDLALPADKVYLDAVYQDLYSEQFKETVCLYSLGSEIESMVQTVEACINSLVNYKRHPDAQPIFFIKEVDEYTHALTLLTWAIILPVNQALFEQLVNAIDSEDQHDSIVDMLIAKRNPKRDISSSLYLPKLYMSLVQAISDRSPQQVANFLSHWYQSCLKRTAYYDIHKLHGGDDSGFNGYWAWEVAGLTYALGIDDSLYQDMAYYPKDLVAYARR